MVLTIGPVWGGAIWMHEAMSNGLLHTKHDLDDLGLVMAPDDIGPCDEEIEAEEAGYGQ